MTRTIQAHKFTAQSAQLDRTLPKELSLTNIPLR